jgi:putative heme degradation protein
MAINRENNIIIPRSEINDIGISIKLSHKYFSSLYNTNAQRKNATNIMSGEVNDDCENKVGSKKNNKQMKIIFAELMKLLIKRGNAVAIKIKNGNIAQCETTNDFPKKFQHKAMYIPKIGGCPLSNEFGSHREEKLFSKK